MTCTAEKNSQNDWKTTCTVAVVGGTTPVAVFKNPIDFSMVTGGRKKSLVQLDFEHEGKKSNVVATDLSKNAEDTENDAESSGENSFTKTVR